MPDMNNTFEHRLHFPATARNRDVIAKVLTPRLEKATRVLEIASGSGQHVAHMAPLFPQITWQPSDLDPLHRASIGAWTSGMANVRPALALDATATTWDVGTFDMVFCANMIHIAPWAACLGLFARTADALDQGGCFALYGPFMEDGHHTAESNARFDLSLKARDPDWGIRDLNILTNLAAEHGLICENRVAMPANNFTVFFRRQLSTR